MAITYTFDANCKVAELRGVTVANGAFTKWVVGGRQVDAVKFDDYKGKPVIAIVAGKPELEALLAAHNAEMAAKDAARKAERDAYLRTPRGQREALVAAEENTYSPDHFPGSAAWERNRKAADALAAFDAAHPDLVAELAAERAAKQKADYDNLSDFVKAGS